MQNQDCGDNGSANEEAMNAALPGPRAVLARYELKHVFNMDEKMCEY